MRFVDRVEVFDLTPFGKTPRDDHHGTMQCLLSSTPYFKDSQIIAVRNLAGGSGMSIRS
jgi:hypothetical protein